MRKISLLASVLVPVLLALGGTPGTAQQDAPPLLRVSQEITPPEIFTMDSGLDPSTAAITITLTNPVRVTPLDVVLVLDASESADMNALRTAAQGVISQLGFCDRVALIVYSSQANRMIDLTDNFQKVRETVADILPDSGSELRGILNLAADEIIRYGRLEAMPAIVLVSTGYAHNWRTVRAEAERVAEMGIRAYAFGASEVFNEHLLSLITDRTGGATYSHFSTNGLAALFGELPRQIFPPSKIVITEVLPSYVEYRGASANPPTDIERLDPHSPTILTWQIPALPESNRWQTTYFIGIKQAGRISVFNELPLIRYVSYDGPFTKMQQITLPTLRLTVRAAPTIDFEYGPLRPRPGEYLVYVGEASDGSSIQKWAWDFGDGMTDSGPVVVHQYSEAGTYTVRLTVKDESGVTATLEKTLTVALPDPNDP
jgi:hypothetical protein